MSLSVTAPTTASAVPPRHAPPVGRTGMVDVSSGGLGVVGEAGVLS